MSIEHLFILGLVLWIFWPKKGPIFLLNLKKAIKNFKDEKNGVTDISKKDHQ